MKGLHKRKERRTRVGIVQKQKAMSENGHLQEEVLRRFWSYCSLFEIAVDGVFFRKTPIDLVTPIYIESKSYKRRKINNPH
jgi:hypothetical protein